MEHENDVHHSDTLEEKLSLSARFGVRINYSIPNRTQFQEMVLTLAQRQGLTVPAEVLLAEANKWGTGATAASPPHGPAVYQLYGWGQRPSICWFGEPDGKKRIFFPGRSIYLKRV